MNYEQIRVSIDQSVATVTLNRPDKLNAWTPQMANELRRAIGEVGCDPECRVIVITGEGRGFCAGADMSGLQGAADAGVASKRPASYSDDVSFSSAPGPDLQANYPGRFGYMFNCPKPIIAAINGPCAGIGLILALYSDLRFAAEDAKFTTAFAARGLIAEHGVAWLLPRLVGEAHALDILLSARKFTGSEAEQIGLLNKALPSDDLMAHVGKIARNLAVNASPRSMAVMKRQIRIAYHQSFAESLEMADIEMDKSFGAPDFKEGVQSFVDRRPPQFQDI